MKVRMAIVGVAAMIATQVFGQYRVVQGKVYSRTAPEWTVIRDNIEVQEGDGRVLYCKTFTEVDSVSGAGGSGNAKLWPVYRKNRTYTDKFMLTNYPSANKFKRGDVIRGPILVMRVADAKLRTSADPQFNTHDNVGYDSTSSLTHAGTVYDYGTDYIAPQVSAAPKPATEAPEKKNNDAAKATFRFHAARAEDGNAGSQYRLGELYLLGSGCEVSTNKARLWFERAAAQGNADAKSALKDLDSQK